MKGKATVVVTGWKEHPYEAEVKRMGITLFLIGCFFILMSLPYFNDLRNGDKVIKTHTEAHGYTVGDKGGDYASWEYSSRDDRSQE